MLGARVRDTDVNVDDDVVDANTPLARAVRDLFCAVRRASAPIALLCDGLVVDAREAEIIATEVAPRVDYTTNNRLSLCEAPYFKTIFASARASIVWHRLLRVANTGRGE